MKAGVGHSGAEAACVQATASTFCPCTSCAPWPKSFPLRLSDPLWGALPFSLLRFIMCVQFMVQSRPCVDPLSGSVGRHCVYLVGGWIVIYLLGGRVVGNWLHCCTAI